MMRTYFWFICLMAIGLADVLGQTENPWIFKKEVKGIKIYYREDRETNLYELKITSVVEGSLSAAVALINDAPNFPLWVYRCQKGKILKKISKTDFIYYNLTDFPWPMSDREFVVHATTYQDPKTLTVYTKSWGKKHSDKILPLHEDHIRVEEVISEWTLIPQGGGKMLAEYYLKSDPGGSIPGWMINMALDIGPLKSLVKFKDMVQSEAYKNAEVPFIKEKIDE